MKSQGSIGLLLLIITCLSVGCGALKNNRSEKAFFPIYGITLGETRVTEISQKRYKCESRNCSVETLTFWDHDDDGVVESIYITRYDKIPDKWIRNFGLNWHLSYSEWIESFKKLHYTVEITESPAIEIYQDRETLSATIEARSASEGLSFELVFDYGNDDGDGYDINSPYSLYSISVSNIKE